MQTTTDAYNELRVNRAVYEVALDIAGVRYSGLDIRSMTTTASVFEAETPCVGSCVSAEIDIELNIPKSTIPRMAELRPYVRLKLGDDVSEYIPKGVFWLDTRKLDQEAGIITLHGYDAMLKAEADFDAGEVITNWPRTDLVVVQMIAEQIGVDVDERTIELLSNSYTIQLPTGYSCREVLGYIAAMYGGNFVMSDAGKLRLITLAGIGLEGDSYLIDEYGNGISFGGDLIGV